MEECIFCGSKENLTREHIIPKRLFRGGNFSNLIILPSCKKCNSYFAKYEESFFTKLIIAGCMKEEIIAKVKKSLNREEARGFGEMIRKSYEYSKLDGADRLKTELSEDDVKIMLGKIFQGLHIFEYNERAQIGETEIFLIRKDIENMTEFQIKSIDVYNLVKDHTKEGKEVFPGYFHYECAKAGNITFFKFMFYDDITFGYFNINP